MSLWPHPTLEESFAALMKLDELHRANIVKAEKALQEAKESQSDFAQLASTTIRLSIMQRDNAEKARDFAAKQPPAAAAENSARQDEQEALAQTIAQQNGKGTA